MPRIFKVLLTKIFCTASQVTLCDTYMQHILEDKLRLASTLMPTPPRRLAVTLTFDLQNLGLTRSSVAACEYSLFNVSSEIAQAVHEISW